MQSFLAPARVEWSDINPSCVCVCVAFCYQPFEDLLLEISHVKVAKAKLKLLKPSQNRNIFLSML